MDYKLEKEFEIIIDSLKLIPGISTKQAKKMLLFFLKNGFDKNRSFFEEINNHISKIKQCSLCTNYTLETKCTICLSTTREKKLMIVENIEQINKFEELKIFNGKYFVVPILFDKKFEKNINYDFSKLISIIEEFDEIIIAISSTPEGILTSEEIKNTIQNKSKIKITHLANGIPIGLSIDYVDDITMSYSFKNRRKIN